MNPKFVHRSNPDGTVDSICICCFKTIATVSDETELSKLEQEHICDFVDLTGFECTNLFKNQREAELMSP
jgi:hypothetical protein